jgi:hypothetical protein
MQDDVSPKIITSPDLTGLICARHYCKVQDKKKGSFKEKGK